MSRYGVHLDSFTSLDELKPKERGDPEAVLAVLRRTKRFSVWDMDNKTLAATVTHLIHTGRVKQLDTLGFPWVAVEIPTPDKPHEGESRAVDATPSVNSNKCDL